MSGAGEIFRSAGAVRIPLVEVTPEIAEFFADDGCLIWSAEWRMWWRSHGYGYTSIRDDAGRYTIADAYASTRHCDPSKGIMFEQVPTPVEPEEETRA